MLMLSEHFSVVHEHCAQTGHNIFKSVKRLLDHVCPNIGDHKKNFYRA